MDNVGLAPEGIQRIDWASGEPWAKHEHYTIGEIADVNALSNGPVSLLGGVPLTRSAKEADYALAAFASSITRWVMFWGTTS